MIKIENKTLYVSEKVHDFLKKKAINEKKPLGAFIDDFLRDKFNIKNGVEVNGD